jgi:glutathione S-transferase
MSISLVIANKNYSSWSMRPWVLLKALDIPFDEIMLKFHSADWSRELPRVSPSGMVPVLWDGEISQPNSICVWESTAIYEYIAERFPNKQVWPEDIAARAHARAVVAEMHAGFRALRSSMPMNIRANHAGLGMTNDVAKNIARIESIWREARQRFAGDQPFLYGAFSAADAMYAPVVMRFATYAPTLAADTLAYCEAVRNHPAVAAWISAALTESEFVEEDEPYATPPQKT